MCMCVHVCVLMWICVCVGMCVCVCVCMRACVRACVCIRAYTSVCVSHVSACHMCLCVSHVCVCHVPVCDCMHVFVCMCHTCLCVSHVSACFRCCSSPVYKTRMMAARALQPLAGKEQLTIVLTTLLDTLPKQPLTADSRMPQSHIHGILLQVQTWGFCHSDFCGISFLCVCIVVSCFLHVKNMSLCDN